VKKLAKLWKKFISIVKKLITRREKLFSVVKKRVACWKKHPSMAQNN